MDRGNVDKHRSSMSGLKVQETEKWGNATAYQRYGKPQYLRGASAAPNRSMPQDPMDKPGDRSYNQVPADSWLRGGGAGGEGNPNFDHSKKRR